MRRLDCSWLLSLALAAPALAAPGEACLRDPRPLTDAGKFSKAGESYYSPDGKRILFQAVPVGAATPWYEIWVMNADGSGQRRVSTGQGKTTCAYFHPTDPRRFIYASTHLDPRTHAAPDKPQGRSYQWDYDAAFDVFEADLETGKILRRLTTADGYDAECSYSHDGKQICFTSRRSGEDSDIWLMTADGENQRVLVRADGTDGGPFFSPDDRWVLYRAARGKDDSVMQVYLTSVDGQQTRQLTDSKRVNWAPFFHPDGQVVCFSANVEGHEFELVLVKADGSRREARLTFTEGFDGLPTFSPDGKRLIWTSNRNGTSQVWTAEFLMPPEEAFQVPAAAPASPHGGGADPHGHGGAKDPHGHGGGDPHGSGGGDPHGSGGSDPHGSGGEIGHPIQPRAAQAASAAAAAPGIESIDRQALLADVRWLADDQREGRRAGTPPARAAAAWVALRMAEAGLEPGAANGTYWQPFEFSQGARRAPQGNALSCAGQAWELDREWAPALYSKSGQVAGQLVFAGFAVRAPEQGHDDLAGLDLTGKVALVLTGSPKNEQGGAFGATHPTVYDDLRYKVAACRDAGAVGVLLVRTSGSGWLRLEAGEPGVLVAQLDAQAAQSRLGLDPAALARQLSSGPASKALPQRVELSVAIERVRGQSENVIGRVTGTTTPQEVLVIGAHYDHLGRGGEGSLAPDSHEVHNGADDNASGVAGVLALARALKEHPPRRTVLLVAFGAEEEGLIGSQRFVEDPPLDLSRVVAMLNLDMIGRLEGRPLVVGGAGTAREWPALLQAAADAAGQPLQPQADGMGPSDHATFYKAGKPVLFLFSGNHADYHRPSDDADRLDMPGAERAARVAWALARAIDALPARPEFVQVKGADTAPRRVVTGEQAAYFGSIPDYASEGVEGVRLSGARSGTPADKAGVQPGDVIVEFAGQRVVTIQDYVNALRLSRPGQTVKVVVMRGGQRTELQATLEGK